MKIYEACYIIGFSLVVGLLIFYYFSTTVVLDIDEETVTSILGKSAVLDSTLSTDDAVLQIQ